MSRQDTDSSKFPSRTPVGGDVNTSENAAPHARPKNTEGDYRLVVENAGQGIVIARDNVILYANPKISEYTGYTREELTSRPFIELIHPEDRETGTRHYQNTLLRKATSPPIDFRIIDKEGRVKWMEGTGVPFTWEGTPSTLFLISDITERAEIELKLRQSEERYRDMVEHTGDLIYVTDSDGNFKFINQTIEREYGYSAGELLGKGFRDVVVPESYAVAIETFKKQVKGIDVGLIEYDIYDKYGQIKSIEAKERLTWKGNRIVEIYGIARDVTDRKRVETALRESEEKYRSLVENLNDVICSTDLEGRVTYVSPSIEQITGYPVQEIIGRAITDFIFPDDLQIFKESYARTINGQKEPLEFRAIRKNGGIVHVRTFSRRQYFNGELTGLTGTITDITERIKAENALWESEEKYRLVVENAAEVIILAVDGYLALYNKKTSELFGYSEAELASTPIIEFFHPDDRKLVLDHRSKRDKGDPEPQFFTARMLTKGGTIVWMENSVVPFIWQGKRAALVIATDISERKLIEDALKESEEKYRLVVENANEIITVSVDGTLRLVNTKALAVSSYSEDELLGTPTIDLVHPDDRHLLVEHRQRLKQGEKTPPPLVMRLVTKDGNIIWTENSIVPILWQGKPAALNIATDITERKRIEDALRESEEKYRLVVENANEIIVITRNGIVEFANNRVMTLFGVPPSALLGRHLSDLVLRSDREKLHDELGRLSSGEQALPFYRYRMRDARGNLRCIEVNGIPIMWEGQPSILSFVSDITEKVDAEEEIKRRLRYEQAVAFCSRELVPLADLELTMQNIVRHLLEKLGVGGVFICKNIMDPVEGISMLTIAEAMNDRNRPPLDFPIPDKVAYKYRSPEMFDALSNGHWFGGPTKDYPPIDREILTIIGSLSSIMIPIFVADTFWGFIGFDDYEIERVWDEQDILLLQTVSSIIGTAVARREAKAALTESEQKYRELVDSTNDMIYVADFKGNLKFVNNAVRQLGYEPDEVIGRNFYEFYGPSSKKYAQELFRLQRTGTRLHGYELDIVRKDGQVRTIEFNDELKWEEEKIVEVRGIGRDVTDRKKMEDRLRLVAGSQEAVLNSLSDMVFFADLSLKITWANSAMSQLTGLPIEEMVGRLCHEMLCQKDTPCEGCPAVLLSLPAGSRRTIPYPVLARTAGLPRTRCPIFRVV